MGLFDKLKKRKVEKKQKLELFVSKATKAAIAIANAYDEKFDFSEESITSLEKLLDGFSKSIPESNPEEEQIGHLSIILGTYLGETLLKNGLAEKGYYWDVVKPSSIPVLTHENGNILTPNDKVYKRLVNGEEDNVVSFYRFAMTKL